MVDGSTAIFMNTILTVVAISLLIFFIYFSNRYFLKLIPNITKTRSKISIPQHSIEDIRKQLGTLPTVDEKIRACQALLGSDVVVTLAVSEEYVSILDIRWAHYRDSGGDDQG